MRNVGLDVARGLLMIYVIVVVHGVFWLGLLPRPYSSLLLLEMPLIFLVSGYAYALTPGKLQSIGPMWYADYAVSRFSRILVPYFAYALVCAAVYIAVEAPENYIAVVTRWLNPIALGDGVSLSALRWHLWFIPTFLIVTLGLPLCKTPLAQRFATVPALLLLCAVFAVLHMMDNKLAQPAFYFIWAFLGFRLGAGEVVSKRQLWWVAAVAACALLAVAVFGTQSLDMQDNKFPPNFVFLAFSTLWVVFFLYVKDYMPVPLLQWLARQRFMRWFMNSGYSLYLWQGIGYSTAMYMGAQFELHVLLVWLIAIAVTITLGLVASPFERVRWRQGKTVRTPQVYTR